MEQALLDTDILSEVLKRKDRHVLSKAEQYLRHHQRLTFSMMSVYEVVRGLKATRALRPLDDFLRMVSTSDVFPIDMTVLMRAAELWVMARTSGHPHADADLIIAATALEHGRVLVTGNADHFSWIPEWTVENWRGP